MELTVTVSLRAGEEKVMAVPAARGPALVIAREGFAEKSRNVRTLSNRRSRQ